MHTRRLASFLIGAWLLGSLLVTFVVVPAMHRQTDAILSSPPQALSKDIEDLGADVARLMLAYQASEATRFVYEIWGIVQIGMACALVATVLFTAHRSKFLIVTALLIAVLACIQVFYVIPTLRATGRVIDFLPLSANSPARETNHIFQVWYQVCEVLKILGAVVFAGRLIIDFYSWQDRPGESTSSRGHRRRHRRKRTQDGSLAEPSPEAQSNPATASD